MTDQDFASFTFSIHVDPLKYKRNYFLWVDVSVSSDVLDGLQGGEGRLGQQHQRHRQV